MEVTLLLNSSTAEQQKQEEISHTTPSRNWTTQDSGGYSLPTLSKAPNVLAVCVQNGYPCMDSPTSPWSQHNHPDRQNSLSSLTSPSSTIHSRISSISTVNSCHETPNTIANDLLLEQQIIPFAHLHHSNRMEDYPQYNRFLPKESPNRLAVIAPRNLRHQTSNMYLGTIPAPKVEPILEDDPTHLGNVGQLAVERISSPRDIISIEPSTVPLLGFNISEKELEECYRHQQKDDTLSVLSGEHNQTLLQSESHGNALVGPASPCRVPFPMDRTATFLPRAEPEPAYSPRPDSASLKPTQSNESCIPSAEGDCSAIACMFITDCDTGSEMRKVISHFFGRNKMCTRKVPQHVWVHYCRKHYQRNRFHNSDEYAKTQCALVVQQIRRIHDWSEDNRTKGVSGVVQDWAVIIRRREQQRLNEMDAKQRKRRAWAMDEIWHHTSDTNRPTAIPEWLRLLVGKGYSTSAVLDIFKRLYGEILKGSITTFPDIEILPNISDESKRLGPFNSRSKRKSRTAGLKIHQPFSGVPRETKPVSSARRVGQAFGSAMKACPSSYSSRSSNSRHSWRSLAPRKAEEPSSNWKPSYTSSTPGLFHPASQDEHPASEQIPADNWASTQPSGAMNQPQLQASAQRASQNLCNLVDQGYYSLNPKPGLFRFPNTEPTNVSTIRPISSQTFEIQSNYPFPDHNLNCSFDRNSHETSVYNESVHKRRRPNEHEGQIHQETLAPQPQRSIHIALLKY